METKSAIAAFLFGAGTSLHCSLMCGPMACALRVSGWEYHGGRIAAYTAAGALCGGVGQWIFAFLRTGPGRVAPWLFLGVLLLMATGLERRIPIPPLFSAWLARLKLQRTLGLLSPLIPCGPLWLLLSVASTSGSVWSGSLLLFWFSLGTLPLYWAIQGGWAGLQSWMGPRVSGKLQRSLIWSAAALLAWRLWFPSPHGCCAL